MTTTEKQCNKMRERNHFYKARSQRNSALKIKKKQTNERFIFIFIYLYPVSHNGLYQGEQTNVRC